ncbi:MAG: hypothetical protein IKV34_01850 [Clostridia bacterium]|nr:hypothetical protein [Clostridia bacterium]
MTDFEQMQNTSEAIGYKCEGCGAPVEFDPATQTLKCNHCGSETKIDCNQHVEERSFEEIFNCARWEGGVKVIQCQNCGAKEVLDKNEISSSCPFCGSPSVLETSELAGIKPDTAIPFKMQKQTATAKCLKWLKSRFFAPGEFKKNVKINSLKGCYLPTWTFDCNTSVFYEGRLGKHYTETYVVNGKTMTRTKTRYFNVSGRLAKNYNDIYVKGSEVVNDKYLQRIQPFDMNDYVKYDDKLLAGFEANHYTIQPMDAWNQAEEMIKASCRSEIVSRYGADVVVYLNLSLMHNSKSFKYLLLPVYISATNYKNKLYNQYVNGVNGNVCGNVPKSPLKIALTCLLGAAALVGLVCLLTLV